MFSQTGRPVVNDVQATFRFQDGLIAEHHDDFDFHRWARQALGLPGLLLGWTPMLKARSGARPQAGSRSTRAWPARAATSAAVAPRLPSR